MLSRLLVLLLLAANLGVAAWLFMTPRAGAPAPVAADPGVAPLVLLSEREGTSAANAEELASAPEPAGANHAGVAWHQPHGLVEIGDLLFGLLLEAGP